MPAEHDERHDPTPGDNDSRLDLRRQAEARAEAVGAPDLAKLSPEEARRLVHELEVHQIELEMQNEELRRTHAELEASRARYFDLYDLAPVGYLTLSEPGLILEANLAAATVLGLTRGALAKQPLSRYILPEDQDIHYRCRKQLLATGEPQVCEIRMVRHDGTSFWARLEATAAQDTATGEFVCRATISDITEGKRVEEELRRSEETLRLAMEATQDGLWDWNIPTNSVLRNPHFYTMLGYQVGEIPDAFGDWDALLHPDDRECMRRRLAEHLRGGEQDYEAEFRMKAKTGDWRWILSRGRIVERDAEGHPVRMVGTHVDITERKQAEEDRRRLEERIRQVQRLEALSRLAAGVAHDFGGLLAVISSNTDQLGKTLGQDHEGRPLLDAVRLATQHTGDMIRSLTAFGQDHQAEKKLVDLAEVLDEAVHLARLMLPKSVEIHCQIPLDEPLLVLADKNEFSRVILNLADNARDAMPAGGTMDISVSRLTEPELDDPFEIPEGRRAFARIVVADSGTGIPLEVQSRIFEPFFTTKPPGRGTGLGLSIVHGIVQDHDGRIDVRSQAGVGTTFTLLLPLVEAEEAADLRPREPAWPRGDGELILVAMKDPYLRGSIASFLENAGYQPIQAPDFNSAVEQMAANQGAVQLAILGVDLSGDAGLGSLDEIRGRRPDQPILVFGDRIVPEGNKIDGCFVSLPESFTMPELAGYVRDSLVASRKRRT